MGPSNLSDDKKDHLNREFGWKEILMVTFSRFFTIIFGAFIMFVLLTKFNLQFELFLIGFSISVLGFAIGIYSFNIRFREFYWTGRFWLWIPFLIIILPIDYYNWIQIIMIEVVFWTGMFFGYWNESCITDKEKFKQTLIDYQIRKYSYKADIALTNGDDKSALDNLIAMQEQNRELGVLDEFNSILSDRELLDRDIELQKNVTSKRARLYYEAGLIVCERHQIQDAAAVMLYILGRIAEWSEEPEIARDYYERSLRILKKLGDSQQEILIDRINNLEMDEINAAI